MAWWWKTDRRRSWEKVYDAYQESCYPDDFMDEKQYMEEVRIINSTSQVCPFDQLEARVITTDKIDQALSKAYDDQGILEALRCISTYLTRVDGQRGARQYISGLRKIGGESAYGYAWLADIGSSRGVFVVKTPREWDRDTERMQLHEFFVGVYGTNKLRDRIPNFVYVMGTFGCSPPFDIGGRGVAYCTGATPVQYILYENVRDSESLTDFVRKCPYEQYLNVVVQLALALQMAYEDLGFTHYDLHPGNVLIRELDEDMYIAYNVHGTRKYLKTRYVATIIDLGMSHIVYNGRHYSTVMWDRAYPMADVYKVVLYSLYLALGQSVDLDAYNPDVYEHSTKLMRYFFPELVDASEILRYLYPTIFTLPYMSEYDKPPVDFFDYLYKHDKDVVDTFLSDEEPSRYYGCGYRGDCTPLDQALGLVSGDDAWRRDPYVFYRMLKHRADPELIEEGRRYLQTYVDRIVKDVDDTMYQMDEDKEVSYLDQNIRYAYEVLAGIVRILGVPEPPELAEIRKVVRRMRGYLRDIASRIPKDFVPDDL